MPTFGFAGGIAGQLETTAVGSTPSNNGNPNGAPATVLGSFSWNRFASIGTIKNDSERGKVFGYSNAATSGDESCQEYMFANTVPNNGKIMVKYWARRSVVNVGGIGPQFKFVRIQGGTSNISDTTHNGLLTYQLANGGNIYGVNTAGGAGNATFYLASENSRLPTLDGIWRRDEFKIVTPSSNGASDGNIYIRTSRNNAPDYITQLANLNLYADGSQYTAFTWQQWYGNGYGTGDWAVDDHYVQTGSFACVELWNTNNPTTATWREIQEPTAWSDTSITVRLNKGALGAGTYYLVVLSDSVTDTVLASRQISIY